MILQWSWRDFFTFHIVELIEVETINALPLLLLLALDKLIHKNSLSSLFFFFKVQIFSSTRVPFGNPNLIVDFLQIFRAPFNIMKSLWELREEFTDAILICNNGQTTFRAHKIFLAAASPFLRNLLLKSNTMFFPQTSKSELESILESIYKGDPDSVLKVGKLEKSSISQRPRKSASVTQLPPEVLVNIFSFLPNNITSQKYCFSLQAV